MPRDVEDFEYAKSVFHGYRAPLPTLVTKSLRLRSQQIIQMTACLHKYLSVAIFQGILKKNRSERRTDQRAECLRSTWPLTRRNTVFLLNLDGHGHGAHTRHFFQGFAGWRTAGLSSSKLERFLLSKELSGRC